MKNEISLTEIKDKWDFDAKNWKETLFPASTYRSTRNAHPKIMIVLRQGYEIKQLTPYDFLETPKYNNVTERRVASLCRAIHEQSGISRSLSAGQREETINEIAWMNIAPPLLIEKNGKKTSNWADIKSYMKMDDWSRAKECQTTMDDLCPEVVIYSGTFGVFYDYYVEKENITLDDISDTLTAIGDLGRSKSKFFVDQNNPSRLIVEISHISTPCVKRGGVYYSFWDVLEEVACGCKEWLKKKRKVGTDDGQ